MRPPPHQALIDVLVDETGSADDFTDLMQNLGYGDVAAWIRPGPHPVYVQQFLLGLERRDRLDGAFVDRVAAALPQAASRLQSAADEAGIEVSSGDIHQELVQGTSSTAGSTSFLGRLWQAVPFVGGSAAEAELPYEANLPPERLAALVAAGRSVARVRLSHDDSEPTPTCCGFLVAPRLLLVPDFALIPWSQAKQMLDDVDRPRPAADDVRVRALVDFGHGRWDADGDGGGETVETRQLAHLDWSTGFALLDLGREVEAPPLRLSTEVPAAGDHLHLIHHPHGGEQRVAVHAVRVRSDAGEQFSFDAPTRPGSAGGPILDDSMAVVALAYGRNRRKVRVAPTSRSIIEALRERKPDVWDLVMRQSNLKSLDPRLWLAFDRARERGEATIPMLLQLADPQADLGDVPELAEGSRLGDVATVRGTRRSFDALRKHPQVRSIEASLDQGRDECGEACAMVGVPAVHAPPPPAEGERGSHALVAVVDSGIDVFHPAFHLPAADDAGADAPPRTRIVALWDQTQPGQNGAAVAHSQAGRDAVARYGLTSGKLYLEEDLNRILAGVDARPLDLPRTPFSRHGTLVTSIAAGSPMGDDFHGGVAPESKIAFVRYERDDRSIGYSAGHKDALTFLDRLAEYLDLPVVVNISNGMNAGAHDGTTTVEKACENFSTKPGRVVVKSAGNEGQRDRHVQLTVPDRSQRVVHWQTGDEDGGDVLEFWFPSINQYQFTLRRLGGQAPGVTVEVDRDRRMFREVVGSQEVLMDLAPFFADNGSGRLTLMLTPLAGRRVAAGDWELRVRGLQVRKNHPIHGWIELGRQHTRFTRDVSDSHTVTIPGTARSVICVGAISKDPDFLEFYEHSSQGPTRQGAEKPDLVAPGVGIRAAEADQHHGLSVGDDGTSLAAPLVTGAVALKLSKWRRDHPDPATRPPLTAEQVRQAMVDRSHPGDAQWDPLRGWGRLDVEAFFATPLH